MVDVLCVYSSRRVDSFTAAWVVRSYYKDRIPEVGVEYVPMPSDCPFPPPNGRDVIILGLPCSAFYLKQLLENSRSALLIGTTILDPDSTIHESPLKLRILSNSGKSISMLTHEHFFGDAPVPKLVTSIGDLLPDQQGFWVSQLLALPTTFDAWDHANAVLGY